MDTRPCDNCGKFTIFALCNTCKGAARSVHDLVTDDIYYGDDDPPAPFERVENTLLSDAEFKAKLARIAAAGAERLQAAALRDEARIWLGPKTQPEEHAVAPAADVRDPSTGLPVVFGDHVPPVHNVRQRCVLASGLPLAPVGDVGGERQALASYDRALDASLQAAHQSLKEIGEQLGLTVADVLRLAKEALAENRERLGLRAEADVVTRDRG